MEVKFYVVVGIGEGQEEIVELPDDEIEEDFLEWRAGYIDSCWVKLDGGAR